MLELKPNHIRKGDPRDMTSYSHMVIYVADMAMPDVKQKQVSNASPEIIYADNRHKAVPL